MFSRDIAAGITPAGLFPQPHGRERLASVEVEADPCELAAANGEDGRRRVLDEHTIPACPGPAACRDDNPIPTRVDEVLNLQPVALVRLEPVTPPRDEARDPMEGRARHTGGAGREHDLAVRAHSGGE